jgi:serine palmitoyltransferase
MEGDVPDLGRIQLLKERYGFVLYCDEAHSFFSLGATGRGVVEYWNEQHKSAPVPWDIIDIRIATVSKAVGGVGGVICGKSRFREVVKNRKKELEKLGFEPISSPQMIQNLWVLDQPTRTRRLLRALASASRFVRSELSRFGIYVYGENDIQILPIYTGPPTLAAELSYMLRKQGLLGTPISHPAVPYWQSRVRLNLSAHHTEDEIDRLIDAIISGCQSLGICKKKGVSRRRYKYVPLTHRSEQEDEEADAAFARISNLIEQVSLHSNSDVENLSRLFQQNCNPDILQRGHDLRAMYGFGSGSSRWVCGTFPEHLKAESLIANITGMDTGMTYPDSWVGAASTIAALARPVIGYGKHYMLLTEDGPGPVNDAALIASPKEAPEMLRYRDIANLLEIVKIRSRAANPSKVYFTIYLHFPDAPSCENIRTTLQGLLAAQTSHMGLTILIHSPSSIPLARQMAALSNWKNVQLLVLGSFYQTFGLPGGFLAGSHTLINELRYTSRGYMFTTSSYPWLLGMSASMLENLKQMEGL